MHRNQTKNVVPLGVRRVDKRNLFITLLLDLIIVFQPVADTKTFKRFKCQWLSNFLWKTNKRMEIYFRQRWTIVLESWVFHDFRSLKIPFFKSDCIILSYELVLASRSRPKHWLVDGKTFHQKFFQLAVIHRVIRQTNETSSVI